jgi:hypothetical protein
MQTAPVDDQRLQEIFDLVEKTIEERWAIPVRVRDLPEPFTGDLDGAFIELDYDLPPAEALFILLHLFGHTVQWNVDDRLREIGMRPIDVPSSEPLEEVEEYERDAGRYSLTLLHELGIHELDQWLADFTAADIAYLMHYYRTGEKLEMEAVWKSGQPRIVPAPIPDFQPIRRVSRREGVVI